MELGGNHRLDSLSSMKRQYEVEYHNPSMGKKTRKHAWSQGLSRTRAIEFIAECLRENVGVVKVRFDNKEILPEHKETLVQIAKVWDKLTSFEKEIKPGAARRSRLAKPN